MAAGMNETRSLTEPSPDPASFRDPAGRVYASACGRIVRAVMPQAVADYEFARACPAVRAEEASGALIAAHERPLEMLQDFAPPAGGRLLEHPRLEFISYPWEWPFSLLKAAALHHLDLQLRLLDAGVALSDASACNVQFDGVAPIFIDWLSLRRYQPGEYWTAHNQFCEQFLHPLLLTALLDVPHHAWYRGSQEGILGHELAALLPWRQRLSLRVWTHLLLPLRLARRASGRRQVAALVRQRPLSQRAYQGLLWQLRAWIDTLRAGFQDTTWRDYSSQCSYSDADARAKARLVREFIRAGAARQVWDLGCNTGEFSAVALAAGANSVIGFDADPGALEQAVERARKQGLRLLPLYQDLANPSPEQGWRQCERRSFSGRAAGADALLALALLHHLVIGRNLPLEQVVSWLVALAPRGLVEFIPDSDPRVQDLLALREQPFPDYRPEIFEACLRRQARIEHIETLAQTGRRLYIWQRPECAQ